MTNTSGFDDENENKRSSSEFAKMLEDSFKTKQRRLAQGDKINCEVLFLGKEEIFVSAGTNTEGVVPRKELLNEKGELSCKIGDRLDLYVTQIKGSEIRLSSNKTSKNFADDLEDAFDMSLPVEGRVTEACKGGVRVSIMGKIAFCPISQLDLHHVENGEEFIGKRLEFQITKFEENGRNIVVSRRKILEEQRDLTQGSFLSEHKANDVVAGKIKRLEKYGAFVELAPGLEGLVHVSEISWSRVNDPNDVISVGQDVSVKILKIETEDNKTRISLSIKQAGEQPWENIPHEVRPGQVVEGRVTRCVKFGAFVELSPGLEGLIPLSEMSYTKRVINSQELVKEGEKVLVMIKEINPETKRIGLSLKDAGSDPWALAPQKFPVGAIVKGTVERREPYGLFVKIEDGVTALLPKSKAMEQPEFPFERLKIGEEVIVQIGELRQEERRISLSVPKDPGSEDWKSYSNAASTSLGTMGGSFGGAFADQLKKALDKKKKS